MTDTIHRFTGRAEIYQRFRQRYPAETILGRLREWCGLSSEWEIADIGAGTGMVAEIFLANGNAVTAVEPNADMREQMRMSLPRSARLAILDTSAEDTGIAAHSMKLVAVGRAFHWFDRERALAEFRRILDPAGWVVFLSLGRATRTRSDAGMHAAFGEQMDALERLLTLHSPDYDRIRDRYRVLESAAEMFVPGEALHKETIYGTQRLDWESLLGQMTSYSIAPRPEDAGYDQFVENLRAFFDRYSSREEIELPTVCHLTAGRLLSA